MPDSNPVAKSFRFHARWNGIQVLGTAIARKDRVELFPVPELCIEIPLEEFEKLAPRLVVAAHTRP